MSKTFTVCTVLFGAYVAYLAAFRRVLPISRYDAAVTVVGIVSLGVMIFYAWAGMFPEKKRKRIEMYITRSVFCTLLFVGILTAATALITVLLTLAWVFLISKINSVIILWLLVTVLTNYIVLYRLKLWTRLQDYFSNLK